MHALEVVLSGRVTLEDAERAVASMGVAPEFVRDLRVDLSQLWDMQIGAGARVGNALRRFQRNKLEVTLPARDALLAYRKPAWGLLFDSGLGGSIERHASAIEVDGHDVGSQFREWCRERSEADHARPLFLHDPHSGIQLNVEDIDAFARDFGALLHRLDAKERMSGHGEALEPLVNFIREAVLNISDHAVRSPLPENQQINAYCSLEWINDLRHLRGGFGLIVQYMRRLQAAQEKGSTSLSFLRISINDDGAGIAARVARTNEIYWGSLEREEENLNRAFEAGFSIKPLTGDALLRGDPGYGFNVMAHALSSLRAFASIRTGRCLAFFDSTSPGPLGANFRSAKGAAATSSSYMPGTLIEALVPFR